jgi:hypothetical protein
MLVGSFPVQAFAALPLVRRSPARGIRCLLSPSVVACFFAISGELMRHLLSPLVRNRL